MVQQTSSGVDFHSYPYQQWAYHNWYVMLVWLCNVGTHKRLERDCVGTYVAYFLYNDILMLQQNHPT